MRAGFVIGSVFALVLANVAFAQEGDDQGRFYGALRGGLNWAHDEGLAGSFTSKDARDLGWGIGAAIGYDFQPVRLELEYMFRRNDIDGLRVGQDGGAGAALGRPPFQGNVSLADTSVNASAFMFNAIYDVPVTKGFRPFLGAGIGLATVDLDYALPPFGEKLLDSDSTELAFQGIAGFNQRLSRSLTAELGYRFLVTAQADLQVADAVDTQAKYKSHMLMIGLRYAFGAPKAAPRPVRPTPAVAPEPINRAPIARTDRIRVEAGQSALINVLDNDSDPDGRIAGIATFDTPEHGTVERAASNRLRFQAERDYVGRDQFSYTIQDEEGAVATAQVLIDIVAPEVGPFLVFFDFDSANLEDKARQIIEEAAQAFSEYGFARIEVVGHTDRSGSADYNDSLSHRRAQTVKAALESIGVPEGAILLDARGESEPLVSTGDGVREPQNRRVEILFPKPGS